MNAERTQSRIVIEYAWGLLSKHDCQTCQDCIHHPSGVGCCGCYDGSCCREERRKVESNG